MTVDMEHLLNAAIEAVRRGMNIALHPSSLTFTRKQIVTTSSRPSIKRSKRILPPIFTR